MNSSFGYFFVQAEDGIRDGTVTGVQTCALPICLLENRADIKVVRKVAAAARKQIAETEFHHRSRAVQWEVACTCDVALRPILCAAQSKRISIGNESGRIHLVPIIEQSTRTYVNSPNEVVVELSFKRAQIQRARVGGSIFAEVRKIVSEIIEAYSDVGTMQDGR